MLRIKRWYTGRLEKLSRESQFYKRWKTDYDFKTFTSASGSLAITLAFAFYNGFLGLYHGSLWYGTICVYYIVLVFLRGLTIAASKKYSFRKNRRNSGIVYFSVSFLLLLLNICLVVPVSMMVKQQRPVNMTLIPSIMMAAYTTYKVTMAAINLRKRRVSSDTLVWLLRKINLIDAFVSILTLQNTLIMVHSEGKGIDMLSFTAVTSGIIWITVLILSVIEIIRGIRQIRDRKAAL